jgi:hypothetical protein
VFLVAVIQQRLSIKCCDKLGTMPTETYEMLKILYGDESLSNSRVLNGLRDLKAGMRMFVMM